MEYKISKNLIVFSLAIFLLFGFGIESAHAYYRGPDAIRSDVLRGPAFISMPLYAEKIVTSNSNQNYNNSNASTNNGYSNNYNSNSNSNNSNNNNGSNKNATNYGTNNGSNQLAPVVYSTPVVYSNEVDDNNGLTALSVRGSGSFMPSSIWQWILVVLLILAIIIIARILARKHTVHEIHHAVPAH